MASDLTTSDILARLDAMEGRSTAERASIRAENRYLTVLMLLVIGGLGGLQIHYAGVSVEPKSSPNVTVVQTGPAATPAPPVDAPASPAAATRTAVDLKSGE